MQVWQHTANQELLINLCTYPIFGKMLKTTHQLLKMENVTRNKEMDVRIYAERQVMGEDAAREVSLKIEELLEKQPAVNIIFAAAPSQNEFLAYLREKKNINWKRVNAFHMDEYLFLADDKPQRFGNFLKERLFDKVPLLSVNYINGNPDDIEEECRRYTALLRMSPADIVCMGIGENGHLAFNDPPVADFNDPLWVKQVELDEICRMQQVNDGCFNTLLQVPALALTLTIPALMYARYIYCMVPGETKSRAVFNTLNMEIGEQYPSTILRKHPHAILFLDQESSMLL